MKKKILIALVGETGAGKDTVANKLPYPKVVSYKTGPMRNSDIKGVTHNFITDEEMDELEKRDDLIAWTKTGDIRYCATSEQLHKGINIYILNPDGVRWFNENYKKDDLNIVVIGLYVPLEERKNRCKIRSDFSTRFAKRVHDEQADYDKFRLDGEFDYLIKNMDSDKTADIIKNIIEESVIYSVLDD